MANSQDTFDCVTDDVIERMVEFLEKPDVVDRVRIGCFISGARTFRKTDGKF